MQNGMHCGETRSKVVELTPSGTRGTGLSKLPPLLRRAVLGLMLVAMRLGRAPLIFLTTVGAKSGRMRRVPLLWFSDGADGWLVVASYGGSARHPAWYVNMAKRPDQVWIEVANQKVRVRVRPESLKGVEREAAWSRIVAKTPAYVGYQAKTDREIPVIRLRPETDEGR
ncbi:MAG: ddn1 [Chloroflexi bacterium]|nr:ddn1 [Chloroflexota bacterium]